MKWPPFKGGSHGPLPVSAENTLRARAAAALYHNPAKMCQKASIRTGRKGERTRIRAGRTAKTQSHTSEWRRIVKSQAELVRLLSRWCVYFRAQRPDFFGTAYPDFPSDPNKCWAKNLFGPCGKRLGRSPHRTQLAQKSRFPHNSETGRKAPPPPTRGVQTGPARALRPVNTERAETRRHRREGSGNRQSDFAH